MYSCSYSILMNGVSIFIDLRILRRCCIKCTHCRKRKWQNFSGVWLIAVLVINPTIHTTFSILQCPRVEKEGGRWVNVRVRCTVYAYIMYLFDTDAVDDTYDIMLSPCIDNTSQCFHHMLKYSD